MLLKQLYTWGLYLLTGWTLSAQTVADFENMAIPAGNQFLNDAGSSGVFESGNTALHNYYDTQFQYWDGWAISRVTNNTTPGFGNQYSAITGEGANASAQYAVGYAGTASVVRLTGAAKGGTVQGIYVTNSTYAYFSMLEGDAFAKRFGGETGNDPDFFKLTIKKMLNGAMGTDSVTFFLADYRFDNSAQDYIVKTWDYVPLAPLGAADSLIFTLSSSDNGAFGMNTPAYFCMDELTTNDDVSAAEEPFLTTILQAFPNPVQETLYLNGNTSEPLHWEIFNVTGQIMERGILSESKARADARSWPSGTYFLRWRRGGRSGSKVLVH